MHDFSTKTVIVTGGADGLGRATAIAAGKAKANVALVDIAKDKLEETAQMVVDAGGKAICLPADVSDSDAVQGYVAATEKEFGGIDGLFNNAGILGAPAGLMDYPDDMFDKVTAINLRGVFLGLKYTLPVMVKKGSGSIVNTASMAAKGGIPGLTGYVASKHGVIGLTRIAALEIAKTGVRVNAILPGSIKTKMALKDIPGDTEAAREAIGASSVPQGRMGTPDEIADAVMFLWSDHSRHITGIELPVDGGITAQVYPAYSS